MEPKLARLWSVYEKARADYLTVADNNDHTTAAAARFLRDTAENTILYLKDKNTDPIMMAELHATCNMAKQTAVSLTGGKKRKFDRSGMDHVRGIPRGPSGAGGRWGHVTENRGYPGEDRRREYVDQRRRSQDTEQGRKGGPKRRGHSDVPYGYARPVDSYQPF